MTALVTAALVVVVPRVATSVAPNAPAVAVPRMPPSLTPEVAPGAAQAMVTAAGNAAPDRMTLGVAVLDLATGELATVGTTRFYSASLSKLMLIVDMLDRNVALDEDDLAWINRALSVSDDNAMNALWVRFDGPGAMARVAGALGMDGTSAPDDSSQWGETVVSPAGFARLYQHILTEMDPADRDVIVAGLQAAQPEAADGFDQFFGLLGQSFPAYAKQGWMYYGSRLYAHSAGVVRSESRDYVVVLMSIQPASAGTAGLSTVAAAMLPALAG